jgi:hypothetical protein
MLRLIGSPFVAKVDPKDRSSWRIIHEPSGEMVGWVRGSRSDAINKLKRTQAERNQVNAVAN